MNKKSQRLFIAYSLVSSRSDNIA